MLDLSVIILSFNTQEVTHKCLDYLFKTLIKDKMKAEVIVIDNGSKDKSQEMLLDYGGKNINPNLNFKIILNKKNLGYPKGNNQGMKVARGRYILFLNSDVFLDKKINWRELLNYMDNHQDIAALTVKVVLASAEIDPASHRGFPTIWNSLCYFFGLEKLFGRLPFLGRIFGGYHLTYLDLNNVHEIDSPTGAFYLVRKKVLDRVKGFDDKNFFFYGEDLDLSWRIKKFGYKIVFYPRFEVTHLKKISGLEKKDKKIAIKTKEYFYDAMKIFYQKHYEKRYPSFVNRLVYFFIDLKKRLS